MSFFSFFPLTTILLCCGRKACDVMVCKWFSADSSGETCPEKKVLYKLISGLHSSISMHIAGDYLLDESRNQVCCVFLSKR